MKLSELNNNELNSLYNLTEKYREYLGRQLRIEDKSQKQNISYTKYMQVGGKFDMILKEINKRINDIEE